jgi:segregation and condensation protein A
MSTARFKLDMFEGPLDLLLHLINKHKLNIYDIEIAVLLEQYLEYMAGLEEEDYEDAADFLEMAARLIYIKTASLLPKDDEGEELKKELQGSLIEYSLCKMAAARLKEQYAGGDIFVREPVKLPVKKTFSGEKDPQELLAAYLGMSEKARHSKPLKAEMFKPILSRRIVSVTSKIIHVLKMLITQGECFLDSMYDGCADKSERVAVFLAVLELTRSGRIFLNDDNTRVYMNSASKKRKISSSFDEAEIAAEEAAHENLADGPAEDISRSADEESRLSDDIAESSRLADIRSYDRGFSGQENAPVPYDIYEPPARTVYKSESRQRSALPVLKIELSPELQKIVEQGRKDMPPDMAAETTEQQEIPGNTEHSAETAAAVSLEKPAGEEIPVTTETAEQQEISEKTELPAETAAAVSLEKPAGEETPVTTGTTEQQEISEKTELPAEAAAAVSLEKPAGEEIPVTTGTTEQQEISENTEYTEAADTILDASESTHMKPNLFGFRYYWGAYGWLNGRLRK